MMLVVAAVTASSNLLVQLASPAARALALAGAAGLGLAAFRVRSTSARLFTWTAALYAAVAMPLLGWLLPPLPVPTPAFLQSVFLHQEAAPAVSKDVQSSEPAATPVPSEVSEILVARKEAARRTSSAEVISPAPSGSLALRESSPRKEMAPVVPAPASSPSFPSFLSSNLWVSIPWSTVAAGIYLAVALFLLLRFFVGLAFGRRLLRASRTIDDARVTERLASRAHASGLAFIPHAAESEFISVPVTMGALRSTLLLPSGWSEWDDAKLNAVIAHEVSHVARRDALTQRLSLLHRAIFWFSPLAWWLDRHLADLAEQASDEAALSCGADRKDYARILLGFFEALQAAPGRVWWQGVSMAKAGQAEQRVERILSWKGSVAMHLKKSIAVVVIALAVPVVYLAASARPAGYAAEPQLRHFGQSQTPPPAAHSAPAPKDEPSATPEPASASATVSASDATPQPEPTPQAGPGLAPPATRPMIVGTVSGMPTAPPVPPVPPVPAAGVGRTAIAPMAPMAPLTPVAPVAPLPPPGAWSGGQSASSGSSYGHGSSYAYSYDDDLRFVVASGKTDSLTMSGTAEDARHVDKLRKSIQGDFIWFQSDEKSYIIRDQAMIDRAREFWAPEEELGKKQGELGKQQGALGKQQEALGAKMQQVHVNVPDMTAELDKLKAELKALGSGATVEQVGHIQSEVGELQSKIGNLQSQAGEKQGELGRLQGALGEKQGKLGAQQGELGRQQAELAQQAFRQMKKLLDEAIAKGLAQPEL